jgi:hypothetical protein
MCTPSHRPALPPTRADDRPADEALRLANGAQPGSVRRITVEPRQAFVAGAKPPYRDRVRSQIHSYLAQLNRSGASQLGIRPDVRGPP